MAATNGSAFKPVRVDSGGRTGRAAGEAATEIGDFEMGVLFLVGGQRRCYRTTTPTSYTYYYYYTY